jgi:hypothetical protein
MSVIARWMLLIILGLAPPAAAAGLSGGQLIVTPSTLSFQVGPPPSMAAVEIAVQVIVSGHIPWRLTVTPLGPLQSPEGSEIPASQVTWQGNPGPVFLSGTLSSNNPQLLARGEGSKSGVVRFFLINRWDLAAGQYSQRLLFNLSSP